VLSSIFFEDITMPNFNTLYRIDECPDLMTDGFVGDEQGNLIFLSVWGRDTATQEFIARLTLGRDEQGLDQFHILTEQGGSIPVFVGNVEQLDKCSNRAYRRTLFGSLVHLWLFDRRCVKPDKANASALALLPRGSDHRVDRLWALVRDTCPLEFPTIVFMQSGYNVYSLQQAARRSWRIGQKQPVRVIYLGYANSSQMTCLGLMARKIMVSQSTSGDVPESGLDVLNQDGDSVEVALARQLVAA
jgi:hypothetical protein